MTKKISSFLAFLIVIFSAINYFTREALANEMNPVQESDDVVVISNPKNPAPKDGLKRKIVFKEELSIGVAEGDENYMFGGIIIFNTDEEGNLIQKVKKEYKKVPVSEEFKKKRMEILPDRLKKITYFPEFLAPYQSFFAGGSSRLFVMTYEEGENPGEFICDIFNPDGVFIGRKSLNAWVGNSFFWAKIKKNFFYCLQEKESGYKKLVVYKMK